MCLMCEPYRAGVEDVTSVTEEDAGRAERERAEWARADPPDPSEYE